MGWIIGAVVLFVVAAIIRGLMREGEAKERAARSVAQLAQAAEAAAPAPIIELRPAAFDVLLAYVDSHHHATERRVTVHRLVGEETPDGTVALQKLFGWCHLHRGNRTFRLDRIETLADPDTGEVIVDAIPYLLARAGHARRTNTAK